MYGGHTFNYLLDKAKGGRGPLLPLGASAPKELIFLCIASPTAGTEMARALIKNALWIYASVFALSECF